MYSLKTIYWFITIYIENNLISALHVQHSYVCNANCLRVCCVPAAISIRFVRLANWVGSESANALPSATGDDVNLCEKYIHEFEYGDCRCHLDTLAAARITNRSIDLNARKSNKRLFDFDRAREILAEDRKMCTLHAIINCDFLPFLSTVESNTFETLSVERFRGCQVKMAERNLLVNCVCAII